MASRVRMSIARHVPVLLVPALLIACSRTPPEQAPLPAPPLATLTVQPAAAAREQVWDGVVEAVDETTIAAQTNARVLELPFDVGDQVGKGDVLVRFTDVEQRSGRHAAEASVTAARAELRDAEANWKRVGDIVHRGLMARAELDTATARRDSARANVRAAEAALRSAGQQADYTVVRAPFDAVVTRRFVQVGEAVQSGPPTPQPLIALASLDSLRVDVVVPQSVADAIRATKRANVLLDDGTRILPTRVTVFPYAEPATHSFHARVDLPRGTRGLYPGMTVKVAFAVGEATRLLVPASALAHRGELSGVYVIGDDNRVGLRQLRLGHRFGDGVEVLAGLVAGERIATDPDAAATYLSTGHAAGKAAP